MTHELTQHPPALRPAPTPTLTAPLDPALVYRAADGHAYRATRDDEPRLVPLGCPAELEYLYATKLTTVEASHGSLTPEPATLIRTGDGWLWRLASRAVVDGEPRYVLAEFGAVPKWLHVPLHELRDEGVTAVAGGAGEHADVDQLRARIAELEAATANHAGGGDGRD